MVVIIKVICIYQHEKKNRHYKCHLHYYNDCGIYFSTLKAFEGFR